MTSNLSVMEQEPSSKVTENELLISVLPHINLKCSKTGFETESDVDLNPLFSMLKFRNAEIEPLFSNSQLEEKPVTDPAFNPSLYFRINAPGNDLQKIGDELLSSHSNIVAHVYNYSPIFTDPAVKFQYANSFYWSGAGSAGRAVTIDVNTRSEIWMSEAGKVYAHYNPKNGPWVDLEIPLLSRCGNYAAFRLTSSQFFFTDDFEFCIKFVEPNGTEHWDNNNWGNYFLPRYDSNIMSEDIRLVSADIISYPMPNWMNCVQNIITGKLLIRDLAFDKNVGIHYSLDGKTWMNASAHWVRNHSDGIQDWEFSLSCYSNGYSYPEFRFAAFYEDLSRHKWHWDNNFGNDYRLRYSDNNSTVKHLD